MPFPRTRRSSSARFIGEIFTSSVFPSSVSIETVVPSRESVSFTGRFIIRFAPSLRNVAWGLTCTFTYKSPATPVLTASPCPVSRIISPWSMPAGMFIFISSCLRRVPRPLHSWHFSFGILPLPSQTAHARTEVNCPRMELRVSWTLPLPLHIAHFSNSVPCFAPFPLQSAHVETFAIRTLRLVPKTASLKEISKSIEMSRPLGICCRAPRPENISPKISPKSNSAPCPPNPCWKPLKSNPPNGLP